LFAGITSVTGLYIFFVTLTILFVNGVNTFIIASCCV
jgi:hypothetical protein